MSTTEAEIIALSSCTSVTCWLRNILLELKLVSNLKIVIYEYNQSFCQRKNLRCEVMLKYPSFFRKVIHWVL